MLTYILSKTFINVDVMGFKIGWLTWEQRKLGEISNIYDGVHQTPNYRKTGVMFLSVENIATLNSNKFISQEDFHKNFKIFPEQGDILMTRIGDVGTPNVVTSTNPLAFYVSLALLKPKNVDSYFLCSSIESPMVRRSIQRRTLVTAIPQKINKDEIGKVHIDLPSKLEEQNKLGSLFRQIDKVVTLQQRKLDQLNTLKKGLLQKMFADKKHPKPELRFKGFSDDWEQCKFEQILISHPYKKYLASPSTNGKYKVIQQGDNPVVGWASGNPFMQYEGATLFGDHTLSLYKPTAPFFVATDGLKILTGKNIKGYYLFTLLEKNKPKSQGYKRHFNILKNEKVVITKNPEEQQQMGCLFKQVDKTITLQQSKLDKLNSLKKSLLQTMFI